MRFSSTGLLRFLFFLRKPEPELTTKALSPAPSRHSRVYATAVAKFQSRVREVFEIDRTRYREGAVVEVVELDGGVISGLFNEP
jgi:hypothetical protein